MLFQLMFDALSISKRLWQLICLIFISALQMNTAAAQLPVGTQTLDYRDVSRNRAVVSELWFSATPETKEAGFSALPALRAVDMALNAEPSKDVKNRPLVIISHGNWGTRYGQAWLARGLVAAGYVVLSVSHPGTMNGDLSAAGRVRLWDRAQDVSFALTQLLSDSRWRDMIDARRVGFVGHSFGGFAGVVLAGGQWSYTRQRQACEAIPKPDLYCASIAKEDITGISFQGMDANYSDARIKTFYIMASGPAAGFSSESLAQIKRPFFVDTAKLDDVLEPLSNSSALAKQISGAKEVIREVGHFTYVPLCKPLIGKLLAAQVCAEPSSVDREKAHGAASHDVLNFFKNTL